MYHTIQEFSEDWKNETAATAKLFSHLTDDSLKVKICDDIRAIGRLAWHIVYTQFEMPTTAGLLLHDHYAYDSIPENASEISASYNKTVEAVAQAVQTQWTDAMLTEKIPMYGYSWTRAFTLGILIRHEIHHRAQLVVLMRQAGLKISGVYGPIKEEWAGMGMPAMP
jgi:uncharacterized damage-inducible protein DinB